MQQENAVVLELHNVSAGYGEIDVLKQLSLKLHQGEIVSVIGANGAGKTTCLISISGLLPLRTGQVSFYGKDISNLPAHERVDLGLAQVPEGRKIFSRMSVLENLELGAFLRTDKAEQKVSLERVYALFPLLSERKNQLGGTLSGGEQQMLAIGRALMSKPKVLLLDEPSMGIAPILTRRIFDALKQLRQDGLSMLLVEQNAHLALGFSDRAYVLELGEVQLEGRGPELLNNPQVRELYLGE